MSRRRIRKRSTSGSSNSLEDNDDQSNSIKKSETRKPKQNPQHLPQDFLVKYLGKKDARGLWGIKHTRKPVDDMVGLARGLGPGAPLPYLQLSVSHRGVLVTPHKNNTCHTMDCGLYPIDTISYGVQDLVYTRVFAMIIVKETIKAKDKASYGCQGPFQCHAFICDSRQSARHLTFALATAFKIFSKSVKTGHVSNPERFAIDLRSPEELKEDLDDIPDSEA